MDIQLDPDLEAYIAEQIASGAFLDCQAVIREALNLKMRLESRHPQVEPTTSVEQLCYLEAMVRCDQARTHFVEECRHEVGG